MNGSIAKANNEKKFIKRTRIRSYEERTELITEMIKI